MATRVRQRKTGPPAGAFLVMVAVAMAAAGVGAAVPDSKIAQLTQAAALRAAVGVGDGGGGGGVGEDGTIGGGAVMGGASSNKRKEHGLFAFGRNNAGQLGLGHSEEARTPQILATFAAKEIRRAAAGGGYEDGEHGGFSLVLSSAGNLFAFGANAFGQLGTGDAVARLSPVPIHFQFTGKVAQVAAGEAFSVAVTEGGEVFTWGANAAGQLGHGDLRSRLTPELVKGPLSDKAVAQVAAGAAHVLVLTTGGDLFTWGSNANSQLGLGKGVVRQSTPTKLQGAITGIKFVWVAAGQAHTLAVSRSGEVYSWGDNSFGQLGLGDLEERPTPNAILHKFARSKITRVAAGAQHSLALAEGGDLFSWGGNGCGQLGYESKGGHKYVGFPKRVETIRAARVVASAFNSLAVLPSGKVFVWGCSRNGELGFGDVTQRTTPHILPTPQGLSLTDVALGPNHVLAVNKRGELYGWGKNSHGQLGLAYVTRAELKPVLIASGSSTDVVKVASGGYGYDYQGHTVAVTAAGKVYVWGWNAFGQLGLGGVDQGTSTPTRLFALETPYAVHSLAAGQYNTLAATRRKNKGGVLFAWGPNYAGQLGHKFLELGPITQPSKVESLKGEEIAQVVMGYHHCLALGAEGTVWAWGSNAHGQLGTGDNKERAKPTPITAFRDARIVALAAGQHSSYAIGAGGQQVWAWGYNGNFELGLGEGTNRNAPQNVRGLAGLNVTALVAGGYHALALTGDGRLYAWGGNQYGQLGLGHRKAATQPELVEALEGEQLMQLEETVGGTMGSVSAGTWHSAAVTADGRLFTWGRGNFGQLGVADLTEALAPTEVEALADARVGGVAAGAAHTMVAAVPGKSWDI